MKPEKTDGLLFAFVLCIGALLRFYGYGEFSLANDELGALMRLQFGSFNELIEKGVYTDGHPAGVQVFLYYWVKLFGISEYSIRLPFVLCSIASLFFIYTLAKRWFNGSTALLSVITIATLEFPLEYGRIARSYAPGVLFLFMNLGLWTTLVFSEQKIKNRIWAGYGITAALCMYTHYFSFLSAIIAGCTGLFLVRKQNFSRYVLGACFAFLLYIPSLKIIYHHFFDVGGLQTLAGFVQKPKPDFILHYLQSSFNDSLWLSVFFAAIPFVSLMAFKRDFTFNRFHFLSLLWFLLPYLTGYFYSVYRDPLLQERMLLFSFPFLIFCIFGFLPDKQSIATKIIQAVVLLSVCTYSTVMENRFYRTDHFPQMSETIAKNINNYLGEKGKENILALVNIPDPYYLNYYFNKTGSPLVFASSRNDSRSDILRIDSILKTSVKPFCLYAWINIFSPPEVLALVRSYYPYIIHKEWYTAAESYLFTKEKPEAYTPPHLVFNSVNDFSVPVKYWSCCDSCLITDTVNGMNRYSVINAANPFSAIFSANPRELFRSAANILFVSVRGIFPSETGEVKLCISFEDHGVSYEWHDMDFRYFISKPGQWGKVYFGARMPEFAPKDALVKIFVWNIKAADVFVDDFCVWVEEGNPVIFGERKDKALLRQ